MSNGPTGDPLEELRLLCVALDEDFDRQLRRVTKAIKGLRDVSAKLEDEDEEHAGHS